MRNYVRANSNNSNYVGGKLYDLPDDFWFDEESMVDRSEEQAEYVKDFADYYVIYRPRYSDDAFELWGSSSTLLYDLTEVMSIKDGIDVIAFPDHIEVVAYDGSFDETVYLYPISNERASDLVAIIDDADFGESTVLEKEIAQSAWSGASIEDILKSWG